MLVFFCQCTFSKRIRSFMPCVWLYHDSSRITPDRQAGGYGGRKGQAEDPGQAYRDKAGRTVYLIPLMPQFIYWVTNRRTHQLIVYRVYTYIYMAPTDASQFYYMLCMMYKADHNKHSATLTRLQERGRYVILYPYIYACRGNKLKSCPCRTNCSNV